TDEYKKWKVISMSTLFDNSIRVIYGNDIAVEAIETENFHPWPDGSVVVKSVWKQENSANGEIRAGDFVNAQFMVKDSKKYTDTEGWGFAKFSGNDLHPTGKTASFAKESCIACHRQLAEKTGYLFDVPMKVNTERLIKNLQK
ncbi:MAG: cytochrome P460, partial [Chryseobacterium sp.]